MVLGAVAGSLLASHAPLAVLAGVFGSVALLIAAKMLLPLDHLRVAQDGAARRRRRLARGAASAGCPRSWASAAAR